MSSSINFVELAIEQMNQSFQAMAHSSSESSKVATSATVKAKNIAKVMQELSEFSEGIGTVVEDINSIAKNALLAIKKSGMVLELNVAGYRKPIK